MLVTASGAGAAPFAYVANESGSVSVIDASTSPTCPVAPCIVKTVPVGRSPGGVAVDKDGTFVYVANAFDNSISVIRTSDNTVVGGPVTVGFGPFGVALSDDAKLYVGLMDGSIAVIDVSDPVNPRPMPAIIPPVRAMLNGVVVVGARLYVADDTNGRVVVINRDTGSVIRGIDVGNSQDSRPMGIVAKPDGTRVYVVDRKLDASALVTVLEVSGIDTALVNDLTQDPVVEGVVIDQVPGDNTMSLPGGIAISQDGSRLYVANDSQNQVVVVSTESKAIVDLFTVGTAPNGVAIDPTGTRVFVSNEGDGSVSMGSVSLIDTTARTVTTVALGVVPSVFGAFATAGPPTPPPPPQFALTWGTAGTGSGSISALPLPSVQGTYAAGTVVTLTAMADAGSVFAGWSGDCSVTSATCSVVMDRAKNVTATFTAQYSLWVTTLGWGTVSADPVSTSWKYLAGTVVTLTAKPDGDYLFAGWTGDACSGSSSITCMVSMDKPKSVTATFTVKQFVLKLNPVGSGTITADPLPIGGTYAAGKVVQLAASPLAGFQFAGWSDACAGAVGVTCSVTMNQAKTATATFTALPPPPPPPPAPTTCDDKIRDLEKKVAADKHPWRHDHQLKAALRLYAADLTELPKAKAKVGASDRRYVRAWKEFTDGKAALCGGRYWHAHHDLWDAYYIAHEILKQHRR